MAYNKILNIKEILVQVDRRLEQIRDISSRLLDDDIPDWESSELAWEEELLRRMKSRYVYWKR